VNLLPRWREHETSPARCKPGATFIPLFLNCCNQLLQTGQHDRNSVTTRHENSCKLRENGHATGEQARNIAMVRIGSPSNRLELDAVGTTK
jgi:hypothetical protein